MFDFKKLPLDGCFEIQPRMFRDDRGTFVKIFHASTFRAHGLETHFPESFYSISHKNVVRGLHFQVPPEDHVKLVTCTEGAVLDIVVDLRTKSDTYGKAASVRLSKEAGNSIYIPKGFAHGFLSLTENSTVIYSVSTEHHQLSDSGILWNSIAFDWPVDGAIVSARDQAFPTLKEFASPF